MNEWGISFCVQTPSRDLTVYIYIYIIMHLSEDLVSFNALLQRLVRVRVVTRSIVQSISNVSITRAYFRW